MKFWPFPLLRNHSTSTDVDQLFWAFSCADDFQVISRGMHRTKIRCSIGTMEFWSANKFYAYASEGNALSASGRIFQWAGCMPSRAAVRALYKRIAATAFAHWLDPKESV